MKKSLWYISLLAFLLSCSNSQGDKSGRNPAETKEVYPANDSVVADSIRAAEISDMRLGMFICWSFSTFSGDEWTTTLDKDASYFKASGCDTDQWCRVAKEAGMGYILFLSKHHDGFCLWDSKTTGKKVTNSPLGIDVLAQLRKSCDKYGIKLALYFSEGDWNWPGAVDGQGHSQGKGMDPEISGWITRLEMGDWAIRKPWTGYIGFSLIVLSALIMENPQAG